MTRHILETAIRCATVLLCCPFFMVQHAAAQSAAKHPITFDDLIHMHRVGGPAISPDGAWVAYAVSTPDMDANRNAGNIWAVRTAGGGGGGGGSGGGARAPGGGGG